MYFVVASAVVSLVSCLQPVDQPDLYVDSVASPGSKSVELLYADLAETLSRNGDADSFALELADALDTDVRFANGTKNQRDGVYILSQLLGHPEISETTKAIILPQLFSELPAVADGDKLTEKMLPALLENAGTSLHSEIDNGIYGVLANIVEDPFVFSQCYSKLSEVQFESSQLRLMAVDLLIQDPSVESINSALNPNNSTEIKSRLKYSLTLYALSGSDWDSSYAALKSSVTWADAPLATATAVLQALALHHPDVTNSASSATGVWSQQNQADFDLWIADFTALIHQSDEDSESTGFDRYGHVNGMLWLANHLSAYDQAFESAFTSSVQLFVDQESKDIATGARSDYLLTRTRIELHTPEALESALPSSFLP